VKTPACVARETDGLDRVQRARADVAEDDSERTERESRLSTAASGHTAIFADRAGRSLTRTATCDMSHSWHNLSCDGTLGVP
jgi:hypothetical protein